MRITPFNFSKSIFYGHVDDLVIFRTIVYRCIEKLDTSCASFVADLLVFCFERRHGVSSSQFCTYNTRAIFY